ncbi:preprotein translocase subunit SecE [Candidatus Curtissbacteria bacterium]|nr:preprotein translocase subunit SecE [Candidatus Curtissbacteria bacterium]
MAINPLTYVKQSKQELDKVIWPTKTETLRLTVIVLLISILIGAYIAGIDAILAKLSEEFLR